MFTKTYELARDGFNFLVDGVVAYPKVATVVILLSVAGDIYRWLF